LLLDAFLPTSSFFQHHVRQILTRNCNPNGQHRPGGGHFGTLFDDSLGKGSSNKDSNNDSFNYSYNFDDESNNYFNNYYNNDPYNDAINF
jgi:hypothetical protein